MSLTTREKNARRLKKAKLQAKGEKIFNDWLTGFSANSTISPRTVKNTIKRIVALPRGWSKEEYALATRALSDYSFEILFKTGTALEQNIDAGRGVNIKRSALKKRPIPLSDAERARAVMQKTCGLIVAALDLANQSPVDEAAVVMEIARYVGRKLQKMGDLPEAEATAYCLATLPAPGQRPEWVHEVATEFIRKNTLTGKSLFDPDPEKQTYQNNEQ